MIIASLNMIIGGCVSNATLYFVDIGKRSCCYFNNYIITVWKTRKYLDLESM